jgi:hypothetical protein
LVLRALRCLEQFDRREQKRRSFFGVSPAEAQDRYSEVAEIVLKAIPSGVGTNFLRAAGALGVSGRGRPPDLSQFIERPSHVLSEGIARRSQRTAGCCGNFAEMAFSTFSTQSARRGHGNTLATLSIMSSKQRNHGRRSSTSQKGPPAALSRRSEASDSSSPKIAALPAASSMASAMPSSLRQKSRAAWSWPSYPSFRGSR